MMVHAHVVFSFSLLLELDYGDFYLQQPGLMEGRDQFRSGAYTCRPSLRHFGPRIEF